MYFSSFILLFILATVLSLSSVQCKDDTLSQFGEKVKDIIPEDTKIKIFNQNYNDRKEIEKTVKILMKKFSKALGGTQLDPCLVKQVNDAIARLLESKQEGALFQAYTNANYEFLKHIGKLNSGNMDRLVEAYVKALNKSAKRVPDDYSIIDTFPALVIGEGEFLKSEKITSEKEANKFIEYLTHELDEAAMTASDDDSHASIKYGLPIWLLQYVILLKSQGLLTNLFRFMQSLH